MKIRPLINHVAGLASLTIVAEGLSDVDVLAIVGTLPYRLLYVAMDMERAQEFLADLEAIVNSEMAEQEIRNALGAGKPEEM